MRLIFSFLVPLAFGSVSIASEITYKIPPYKKQRVLTESFSASENQITLVLT